MENTLLESNIVFMFPGVGSQYFRMGEELYRTHAVVREAFKEASEALDVDLYRLCYEEKDGKLDLLEYAKPALVCLSVATYRAYMEKVGIEPKYCMGYSLGEYSALCCAGLFKLGDAVNIVRSRARIVNEVALKQSGTMAWVINTPQDVAEKLCHETYEGGFEIYVSSYDSKEKLSVSGSMDGIRSFAKKIEDAGGMVIPIKMSGPFHSPLMKEASEKLRELLQKVEFSHLRYKVLANRSASPYSNVREEIIENLSMQLCQPILWNKALHFVIEEAMERAIEIGPKNVLKYLTETNTDRIKAYSVEKTMDMEKLINEMALCRAEYIGIIKRSLGAIASTRNSCRDKEMYETYVVGSYKRLVEKYERYQVDGECSREEVEEVLQLLELALRTKGLEEGEIGRKIRKVLMGKEFILDHSKSRLYPLNHYRK